MNEKYAFEDQILANYPPCIFDLFQKTFNKLPLATIIHNFAVVCHGG